MISVAAELVGMHPQTLRIYERKGLLDPSRTSGGSRRFSERDLERLQRIQELTNGGLNLEGVRRVLELEREVAGLRDELERVRAEARGGRRPHPPQLPPRPRTAQQRPRSLPERSTPRKVESTDMPLDPERWTVKTREALAEASQRASAAHHAEIGPAHLLAAVLAQPEGIAGPLLERVGTSADDVRRRLDEELGRMPRAVGGSEPGLGREARDMLEAADVLRKDMGDDYLSVEHLLLTGAEHLGVSRDELLAALREVRGSHRVTSATPEETFQALEKLRA